MVVWRRLIFRSGFSSQFSPYRLSLLFSPQKTGTIPRIGQNTDSFPIYCTTAVRTLCFREFQLKWNFFSSFYRVRRQLQILLVFLSSPPCILFLLIVIYSFFMTETKHFSELMRNSKTLFRDSILLSLRDSALIGTWSYPVITLLILPNWLLFWCVANMQDLQGITST